MIVQMMRFKEEDRIEWNELFNSPLFQTNLLIEVGLNVFNFQVDDEEPDDFANDFNQRDFE
jgi:serine/threonine-protein kinase ULK/ATG1